jgi:hypothetical protein
MLERKKEYSLSREDRSSNKRNDSNQKIKNKISNGAYGIMQLSKHQTSDDYSGCCSV